MRNAVATRSTPGRVEIEYQDLAFVLGKNGPLAAGEFPAHVGKRRGARRRHRVSGAGWWIGDYGCWLRAGVVAVASGKQHQAGDQNARKKVSPAAAQRRSGY